MDPTTLNTLVGIVGIISTVISIIVGIIGGASLYQATKISNKAKADNGATVQQAHSIYYGLSAPDVIDITERKIAEKTELLKQDFNKITNKIVSPSMFLKLTIVSYGSLIFWKNDKNNIYEYEFELLYSENSVAKRYKVRFWYDQKNIEYPHTKCKILDPNNEELLLTTYPGFLEIIPQNIFKDIPFKCNRENEVLIVPNQTVIGKSKEGHIILVGVELIRGVLNMNTALYMQWSDGLNDQL